nr:hypothetical protein [Micromonospora sp. DSM 115978]
MDFKEYVLGLAAEQGCDLDWKAVVEAAEDDPEEVVEALEKAALVAARQLVGVVLVEAAADLRERLANCRLEEGVVEDLAGDLAQVGLAYRNSRRELAERQAGFLAAARGLAGV